MAGPAEQCVHPAAAAERGVGFRCVRSLDPSQGLRSAMESALAYFGGLLVRGSSKELLGWTAQDLQHALRWAEYWERVMHGMAASGDAVTRAALEAAVVRLRVKFPALRLSVGDLGSVRYPSIDCQPTDLCVVEPSGSFDSCVGCHACHRLASLLP